MNTKQLKQNWDEQEKIKGNIRALIIKWHLPEYKDNSLVVGQETTQHLANDTFYDYWLLMVKLRSSFLGNHIISHIGNSNTLALIHDYEELIKKWQELRKEEIQLLELEEKTPLQQPEGVQGMLVLDDTELKKEYDILGISGNTHPDNVTIREVVRLSHIIVNRFRTQRIRKLFEDKTLKKYDDQIAKDNKKNNLKTELFPKYTLKFVWTNEFASRDGKKKEMNIRRKELDGNSGNCSNDLNSQITTLRIQLRHIDGEFSPTLTLNTLAHEMTHSVVGSGWVNHSQVKKEYLDHFKGGNFYLDVEEAKIDHAFGSHTPLFWIYFLDRTVNGLGASAAEFVYGELKDTSFQEEFGQLCSLKTIPAKFSVSDVFKCYYSDVRHDTEHDTHLTSPLMDGESATREWYQAMSKVCAITTKSLEENYNTVYGVVDFVKHSPEFHKEAKLGIAKYLGFDLRACRGTGINKGKFFFKLYLSEYNLNGETIWNYLSKRDWSKSLTFILSPIIKQVNTTIII